ncbi:hypothetical protein SAMD00023353_1701660 [Rosellinia necatrix]|uniref:Uncharacterized protein n=1 Tax=Rosellinia necatrix TaxID=77044 RepID=A0A1S8A7N6_ROSNE|nr:hypothetical protein SAMD00023353_1701660 [Rosellinia necatrix]
MCGSVIIEGPNGRLTTAPADSTEEEIKARALGLLLVSDIRDRNKGTFGCAEYCAEEMERARIARAGYEVDLSSDGKKYIARWRKVN